MDMVSVFIPVFKESNLLETLLNKLIKDSYEKKEIITVIDEPTENSLKTIKKYKNRVKFILNKQRKGKATALNEAAKIAKGDIFLFLDADCIISKNVKNFLKTIVEKIKDADLLDIKKNTIIDSFLSKMNLFENMGAAVAYWLFDKINICGGVCGQGFAIKRYFFEKIGGFKKVIAEDLEIGIQTYLNRKKYRYTKDIEIYSKAPSTWNNFFKQRKKWGLGMGYHLKKYWKPILKGYLKHPKDLLISLYCVWPTLLSFLILFFIDSFLGKFLMVSLISFSFRFSFLIPILLSINLGIIFIKNMLLFLIAYIFSFLLFFVSSKKFGYKFKAPEFTFYYLFYSPLYSIIFGYYFLRALFSSEHVILKDWKV